MKTYRSPKVESRNVLVAYKVLYSNMMYYAKRCKKMFFQLANADMPRLAVPTPRPDH